VQDTLACLSNHGCSRRGVIVRDGYSGYNLYNAYNGYNSGAVYDSYNAYDGYDSGDVYDSYNAYDGYDSGDVYDSYNAYDGYDSGDVYDSYNAYGGYDSCEGCPRKGGCNGDIRSGRYCVRFHPNTGDFNGIGYYARGIVPRSYSA